MDRLLPPGSMERRERNLSPEHAAALAKYREQTAREISRLENQHGPDWIEQLLDGEVEFPPFPAALRNALNLPVPPVVTEDTIEVEAAEMWRVFCHGDER